VLSCELVKRDSLEFGGSGSAGRRPGAEQYSLESVVRKCSPLAVRA
jgi:hypothetical protein